MSDRTLIAEDPRPATRPRPAPPRRPRRSKPAPGQAPAGQVLVVMLIGLVLAALVNADVLVEKAERKPFGPGRDRSLAIWHPVQDLAHVSQLFRIRALGDDLLGHGEHRGGPATSPPPARPPEGSPTTTVPEIVRPELRAPTAADPLRVYIGGDSVVRDAGESFMRLAAEDPLLAPSLHYENMSGVTRPDFFDWPAALLADAASQKPDVMVLLFGGNDAQPIVSADGTIHDTVDSPGWRAEYGLRVGSIMDSLRADDRLVMWVTMPPVRSSTLQARVDVMNEVYRAQAADRPWIQIVESARVLGDADGRYVERHPDSRSDLRQDDGIHLSRTGADLLAEEILRAIRAELPPPPTTTTTTVPAPTATTAG